MLIVGGGISGAWLALHCSNLGYRTALIEQDDYASQTSSASSKLLHSGIRYLQQMQFLKVRESALERAHYLYAAPHLSKPVPFAVPTYRDFARSKLFLNCGMLAYRTLCLGENNIISSVEQELPPIHSISAEKLSQISGISDTNNTGAVVFYERHMQDSERMVLAILQSAQKSDAVTLNYVKAITLLKQNEKVVGVTALDQLSNQSFDINSKLVINAAGPWVDQLNTQLTGAASAPIINGFAVGSHIICRKLADHAIAITTKHKSDAKIDRGGRHVFIIPWRGYSLIGTSYDEIESAQVNTKVQNDHVQQLLEAVNDSLPDAKLSSDDLISGYSGLYPLKTNNIQSSVYQGSGEYKIVDHLKSDKTEGLITALGAKYTTGRKLSALTLRLVGKKLNGPAKVRKLKLHSSQYQSLEQFRNEKRAQYKNSFSNTLINHLIDLYGSDLDAFVQTLDDDLIKPICRHLPDIFGQIVWAIEAEQAVQLKDVIFNRSSIGYLGINDEDIRAVAELMAKQLQWSDTQLNQQLEEVLTQLNTTRETLSLK